MIFTVPRLRGTDPQGSGAYGAPRIGGRKHKGVDYAARPGTPIYSVGGGVVRRLGYPSYRKNRELRLIEIMDMRDSLIRYMYVQPAVQIGDRVIPGDLLGTVQRLPYRGITQHVHVDVRAYKSDGLRRLFVNPIDYFKEYGPK